MSCVLCNTGGPGSAGLRGDSCVAGSSVATAVAIVICSDNATLSFLGLAFVCLTRVVGEQQLYIVYIACYFGFFAMERFPDSVALYGSGGGDDSSHDDDDDDHDDQDYVTAASGGGGMPDSPVSLPTVDGGGGGGGGSALVTRGGASLNGGGGGGFGGVSTVGDKDVLAEGFPHEAN